VSSAPWRWARSWRAWACAPPRASVGASRPGPAAEEAKPSWAGSAPLVADIDGDGTPDLIGRARRVLPEDRITLVAVDGATGTRWTSLRGGVGSALAISDGSFLLAVEIAIGATRWKFP